MQGRYEEAIKYETEGLALAREVGDKLEILVLSSNLSNIHEDQGEYGPALLLLNDARKLAQENNDKAQQATCLIYFGNVRRRLGDSAGAQEAFQKAQSLARDMGNAPLLAEALASQAAHLVQRGQRSRALPVAKEALAKAQAAHDHRLILLARLQAGEAAQSTRDLGQVLDSATASGLAPVAAATHLSLARVHLAAGRPGDAISEAELAQKLAAGMNLRDILFQACHLAGKGLKSQGQTAAAADKFSSALGQLEEMRRGLGAADLRQFLERPETVAFARDAETAFQDANHTGESSRLRLALSP